MLNLFLCFRRRRASSSNSSGLLEGESLFGVSFSGVDRDGLRVGDTRVPVSICGGVDRTDAVLRSGLSARQKSSSAWLARFRDSGGHGIDSFPVPDIVSLWWSRWTGNKFNCVCDDGCG